MRKKLRVRTFFYEVLGSYTVNVRYVFYSGFLSSVVSIPHRTLRAVALLYHQLKG